MRSTIPQPRALLGSAIRSLLYKKHEGEFLAPPKRISFAISLSLLQEKSPWEELGTGYLSPADPFFFFLGNKYLNAVFAHTSCTEAVQAKPRDEISFLGK